MAFALVEIALLAYLLAPTPTARAVTALHEWIKARSRSEVAIVLAVVGCAFLVADASGV